MKSLNELFVPDFVHGIFMVTDVKTGLYRNKTVDDHFAKIETIRLNSTVPNEIIVQFETAKNILLYSWYVSRFSPVSELQAYISLEFALRLRTMGDHKEGENVGLGKLLSTAVSHGWLTNDGIRQHKRIEERQKEAQHQLGEFQLNTKGNPVQEINEEYVSMLSKVLPKARNMLAHGSEYINLISNAYLTLEICCDLINQLFLEKQNDYP